jgi:predicted NAD/FAD-binding protein
MRIAIIGAGISGLVCADMLHSDHDVVVFEAESRPGGHANTVRVQTEQGTYDVRLKRVPVHRHPLSAR